MKFLNSNYARILTLVLLLQAGAYYAIASRAERVPSVAPLSSFPAFIGSWQSVKEIPVEKEIQEILKADDTLSRQYASLTDGQLYLFLAYFQSQRKGQSPHSPKNCLPGAGWEEVEDAKISIDVPGRDAPILINKFVVAHGEDKSLTLYWYQSHGRVIASEFSAKFWLVVDAIRYHRSDTSLVRVSIPVRDNNIAAATQIGVAFVKSLFPQIEKQLPM
jgi:EpsI family protein